VECESALDGSQGSSYCRLIIEEAEACVALEDLSLEVDNQGRAENIVSWESNGDCAPFEGILTASYEGEDEPYEITEPAGSVTDEPRSRCEGTFNITYSLVLEDKGGRSTEAAESTEVVWIC